MRLPEKLFIKDINRPIETVVKADDRSNISQEVNEYVVTREISNQLGDFFEYYNDKGFLANGAWISGFFGSGKSHLLKILSYVLENKEYNGTHVGDIFAEKITDDYKLKGDILKCVRNIPSESILFNIDQHAQITSKSDVNAILKVFYKVFYDHQGFYGFQPHVAAFEESVSSDNKYDSFKEVFAKIYGTDWTDARKDYIKPQVSSAIAETCGTIYNRDPEDYKNYLQKFQRDLKQSVEDFALKVSAYIKSKGNNFRLNFYVDEVGQFIAGNTKLMLNLQTIAETLFTKCNGDSWVIVTSQEDLESIVGDDSKTQTDDFSRIQARFKARLPLTSANVDEVIEKRLLDKSEEGTTFLSNLYKEQKENIKTLITFSSGSIQFRGYSDENDFVNKYPFLPYQFDLFQQCLKTLSKYNVFQGQHQSVGERSMLGVFQFVLKQMRNDNPYDLVSFDRLYDGIAGTIRSEARNTIILAENNLDEYPIRVLKVLFMIKYYEGFKGTFHNISILLLSNLKTNLTTHNKAIEESLNLLEQQNYIQVNGDEYEFLTDDEKEVEVEIKKVNIDENSISDYINKVVFDGILKDNKIRFADNKQDFEFTRRVDGIMFQKEKELKIEIITTNFSEYEHVSHYQGNSMADNTLMYVVLPPEKRLIHEVRLYLQTDRYIRQSNTGTMKDSKSRILYEKGKQNAQRNTQLTNTLNHLIGQSTIYMGGSENRRSASSDGRSRIIETAQDLIQLAYPKLKLLGSTTLDETQLNLIMSGNSPELFPDDALSPPEQEVINYLERRKDSYDRTTLKDIRDNFSRKPYGWSTMSTWCIIAHLFKRDKIEATLSSNSLDDKGMHNALNNNREWDRTLITPQIQFNPRDVTLLKQVYQEAFNESNPHIEAKAVAIQFKNRAEKEEQNVRDILSNKNEYPFLQNLEQLADLLHKLSKMEYGKLITEVRQYQDELLDLKEDLYDPILQFWNGEQKKIFDRILIFQKDNQANFDHVEAPERALLKEVLEDTAPYKGSIMKEAKDAMDKLSERIKQTIEEERSLLIQSAEQKIEDLKGSSLYYEVADDIKRSALKPFEEIIDRTYSQRYIGNMKVEQSRLSEIYAAQLNYLAKNKAQIKEDNGNANGEPSVIRYTTLRAIEKQVKTSKSQLESMSDVDSYLRKLRDALEDKINDNYKITLN
ncbi:MAG: BREX system P-loop protein BrxC [Fermentimonas sp.]